jgi:hypothetical protein
LLTPEVAPGRVVAEHAAWHARGMASDGSRRMTGTRANIKPYPLPERPAGKLNVTDRDSRNLKATRGWVQGYNAQAAVTPEQIVIAAEISTESLDSASSSRWSPPPAGSCAPGAQGGPGPAAPAARVVAQAGPAGPGQRRRRNGVTRHWAREGVTL